MERDANRARSSQHTFQDRESPYATNHEVSPYSTEDSAQGFPESSLEEHPALALRDQRRRQRCSKESKNMSSLPKTKTEMGGSKQDRDDDASSQVSINLDSSSEEDTIDTADWDEISPDDLSLPEFLDNHQRRNTFRAPQRNVHAAATVAGGSSSGGSNRTRPAKGESKNSKGQGAEKVAFDEDTAVVVNSSDSDLDWDAQPFDYTVPLGPLPHESYQFERQYPSAAPLLRQIASLSHGQRNSLLGRVLRRGIESIENTIEGGKGSNKNSNGGGGSSSSNDHDENKGGQDGRPASA